MEKNILLILGHPNHDSFCGAVADAYVAGVQQTNANIKRINLSELNFDPILWKGYEVIQELEPDLIQAQEKITWANHLVMVYPTWWAAMPALLKGFIDRVFLPGFAFTYQNGMPIGLLKNKSAHFITTMDSPTWYYKWFVKKPGHMMLKKGILEFSGIKPVKTTELPLIKTSTTAKRKKYLSVINKLGQQQA